jgi:hypothetical protein
MKVGHVVPGGSPAEADNLTTNTEIWMIGLFSAF